jgi:primosomal protein N' (replication factor Y)
LQTFDPGNQVIQSAARHDADGFYRYEVEQRGRLGYPPFSRLVRLEFRHHDASLARQEAQKLASRLGQLLVSGPSTALRTKQITLIGPVPSFFAKLGGYHRWQIILRGPDPLLGLREDPVKHWLVDWRVEVDPISLL